MTEFRLLQDDEWMANIRARRAQLPLKASVVFSSWAGGLTKNPVLAQIPLDDHMVHRGDAVFEAMRFGFGGIYLWSPHWLRLKNSAEKLGLNIPYSEEEFLTLLRTMVRESGLSEGLIRIYLARGPGSFAISPYDSPRTEVYAVVSSIVLPPQSQYEQGVKICLSKTASKEGLWAQVKSCNYLVNVMVKKGAIDRGFDYGIAKTSGSEITESSTENLLVYTSKGELLYPNWDHTLKGTTLIRVLELAKKLEHEGKNIHISQRPILLEDVESAKELMLVGTTLGVLPVGQYENKKFSEFVVSKLLAHALSEDIKQGVNKQASAAL